MDWFPVLQVNTHKILNMIRQSFRTKNLLPQQSLVSHAKSNRLEADPHQSMLRLTHTNVPWDWPTPMCPETDPHRCALRLDVTLDCQSRNRCRLFSFLFSLLLSLVLMISDSGHTDFWVSNATIIAHFDVLILFLYFFLTWIKYR